MIVDDDKDREDFVTRMGSIALDTGTSIYARPLMTNHAHILLRSSKVAVAILQSGGRHLFLPKLRRAIASKLINEYGVSLAETSRQLGISTSGVAQILRRSGGS
jgi:hypothetical protein